MGHPVTKAQNDTRHDQISAFLTLWSEFQENTSNALRNVISKKIGKILWSSRLTNGSTLDALPPDEYKIQFGGDASDTSDPQLKTLFDKEWLINGIYWPN